MSQAKIILVAGPTASGKSAFALDLAHKINGAIVNTDALQVYRGLPILSAQPSGESLQKAPHFLYSVVEPQQRSSAGKWVEFAHKAITEIIDQGMIPILVGGTGLYFKALLGGLADIPDISEEIRARTQMLYEEAGEEKFRSLLNKIDPVSATKLERNDRQRLIRAYEVASHTGKPLDQWHKDATIASSYQIQAAHLLMPERDVLYRRCNERFQMMMKKGALDEARSFLQLGLAADMPVMKTLGLRELIAFLKNEMTLDQAISKAQQMTRNYAKRQMTWFRHQWRYYST